MIVGIIVERLCARARIDPLFPLASCLCCVPLVDSALHGQPYPRTEGRSMEGQELPWSFYMMRFIGGILPCMDGRICYRESVNQYWKNCVAILSLSSYVPILSCVLHRRLLDIVCFLRPRVFPGLIES